MPVRKSHETCSFVRVAIWGLYRDRSKQDGVRASEESQYRSITKIL